MKMEHWSDYEKYICMVHGEGNTPLGVGLGYQAFLSFKKVMSLSGSFRSF